MEAGQELTIDYNATEKELLGGVFTCACGAEGCVGEVRGWGHLSSEQQQAREHRAAPWLTLR